MESTATILQITRGLLILTPAKYDKPEASSFAVKNKRPSQPTTFSVPQIFELNDSLKDHPFEKAEELAAFVKRCAESASIILGDVFICIEDEDVLITKEYKHAPAKEKLLPTFARVEAGNLLHNDVDKYTILNFEYGQQYGKQNNKGEDVSASLFAMQTGLLTDLRAAFMNEGITIVKVVPPIAGMLYTCKTDLSPERGSTVAVISMDFAATRLVIIQNGVPLFQQSYSSVLEDIAEMFSLEFGMSKLGAIDLIRQEGLGVCSKCKSAATQKQTMTMLDNAANEVVRNLRMIMSTKRLDIDSIVLIDVLAKLPNIANYCRQIGLSAPMESFTRILSGTANAPVADSTATEKSYDTTSFVTLNGILTMPVEDANLLAGENNILSAMSGEGGSKLGRVITAGLGVAAGIWIVAILGWWGALAMRENNDNAQLQDTRYAPAKQLIADEAFWKNQLENMDKNLELLPNTDLKSADVVTEIFAQVRDKVITWDGITMENEKNEFRTDIYVDNLDAFVKFKDEINEVAYFKIGDAITYNTVVDKTAGGTNPIQRARVSIILSVTKDEIARVTAEAEEARAKAAAEAESADPNKSDLAEASSAGTAGTSPAEQSSSAS